MSNNNFPDCVCDNLFSVLVNRRGSVFGEYEFVVYGCSVVFTRFSLVIIRSWFLQISQILLYGMALTIVPHYSYNYRFIYLSDILTCKVF